METESTGKIEAALRLLSEAAVEKKDTIRHLIAEKFGNLKDVLGDAGGAVAESWTAARQRIRDAAVEAKNVSVEKIQEVAKTVDSSAHRNPWSYVGGVAVGALLLGFFMGRYRNGNGRR
jgi:ElaB/YqjD/DUF883 family membrane-anchored ribosome-binding protein